VSGARGSLEGRTGLVTGASRGIGRAVAERLAGEGVRLVVSSRGGADLRDAAEACGAEAVPADLRDPDRVDALAARTREVLGGVPGILVNNAGVFRLAPARETDPDVFDLHLAVNLSAPFRLVRAFLPGMLERGRGDLLHVGSVAGRQALPGNAAYSASKFGLRGMHEVLREELSGTGVRSLLLEPGPVDTGAWDELEERLGRDLPARSEMLPPERVADAAVELLRAGEVTELAPGAG
jgi:NAD(P)-dependent dehydrogenase (short-subunit alcohol dehydrogenase family)